MISRVILKSRAQGAVPVDWIEGGVCIRGLDFGSFGKSAPAYASFSTSRFVGGYGRLVPAEYF
jgi:hypothetical protein